MNRTSFKLSALILALLLLFSLSACTGPAGKRGPQGMEGEKGDPGETGAPGIQGEVGPQGPQGIQGEQGIPGEPGSAGADGEDGLTPYIKDGYWWIGETNTNIQAVGSTGEKGDKGDTGEKGDKGDPGTAGAKGENGETPRLRIHPTTHVWEVSYNNGTTWISLGISAIGVAGADGADGKDGINGTDGKDGIDGADGLDGTNGKDGVTPQLRINSETNLWEVSYDSGANWTSLNVPATGADGADGKDGVDGADGTNGADGKDGIDGAAGKDGVDGTDGVSVTNAYIDDQLHLWIVLSDETKIDAGYVGVIVTPVTYTVTFADWDGTVLKTHSGITAGGSATAPADPARDGYTFAGWDVAFDNVTSDLTVTATYTQGSTAPTIEIATVNATAGESGVQVTIAVKNNPGIASLNLSVTYANALTLTDISYNTAIGGMSQQPQKKDSPVILNWVNGTANSTGDWVFATLTFDVAPDAMGEYDITLTYDPNNVYDITETNIAFDVVAGKIVVS